MRKNVEETKESLIDGILAPLSHIPRVVEKGLDFMGLQELQMLKSKLTEMIVKMTPQKLEHFDHDDCPQCSTPSVPLEGVPDQTLRGCSKCYHEWWEDLTLPVQKGPK